MTDQTHPSVPASQKKRALVIAGGGDRGAFAVGALREMFDREIGEFDIVAGTSTGGLISPMAAIGEIDVLEKTYLNAAKEDIYTPHDGSEELDFLQSAIHAFTHGKTSFTDTAPLRALIEKQFTPENYQRLLDRATAGKTQVRVTALNYRTQDVELIDPADFRGGALTREEFIDALMATSAVPLYFPPQQGIGERSGDSYLDGALKVSAPIYEAIELGAEELYVVSLAPEHLQLREHHHPRDLEQVALGTIGALLDDVGREDVRRARDINHVSLYLLQLQAYVRTHKGDAFAKDLFEKAEELFGLERPFGGRRATVLHLIQPPVSYGDTLEFGPSKMRRMYNDGKAAAKKVLDGRGELRAKSLLELIRDAEALAPSETQPA